MTQPVQSLSACRKLVDGLDHPEAVALGPSGELYAGGEAGQVYRVEPDGTFAEITQVGGGLVAGIALDEAGDLYVCDIGGGRVVRVRSDGSVDTYNKGDSLGYPNFGAFDAGGRLFVTDSGDYYGADGRLLVIHPGGEVEVMVDWDLRYPNGLALDPSGSWLFLAQSGANDILRFPLEGSGVGIPEALATIPGVVPDGLALATDGTLYVGCYAPDAIYRISPDGEVEPFLLDPWADMLNRPTNLAFGDGVLYFANLGGYHLGVVPVDDVGAPLFRPALAT